MAVNGLEITDIIIFPLRKKIKDSEVVAFAKIIINDQFIINGIKVHEGRSGLYIEFPQEYNKEGKGYDICFPITVELRCYITDQILAQYSVSVNLNQQANL